MEYYEVISADGAEGKHLNTTTFMDLHLGEVIQSQFPAMVQNKTRNHPIKWMAPGFNFNNTSCQTHQDSPASSEPRSRRNTTDFLIKQQLPPPDSIQIPPSMTEVPLTEAHRTLSGLSLQSHRHVSGCTYPLMKTQNGKRKISSQLSFVCSNCPSRTNNFVWTIRTFWAQNLRETQQRKSESQLAKTERNNIREKVRGVAEHHFGEAEIERRWGRMNEKGTAAAKEQSFTLRRKSK